MTSHPSPDQSIVGPSTFNGATSNPSAPVAADEPDQPIVLEARGLTKRFKIYKKPADRLVEWATLGRTQKHKPFVAVDDVSFSLKKGRCLGLVGANGAGKSTLLKMLTGVLRPSAGSYRIRGRVLSLLELSAGLDGEMTGRENIRSMATLLNFPREFAAQRTPEIQAFSELGEFFDRPVRQYSTGMRARLGFSMYACFRPDIFIVDEVLSVGDVFFRQKCATRMRQLLEEGMTMMFVSHDAQAVLNLCDEAILLQKGRMVFHGPPEEVMRRHHSSLSQPVKWTRKRPQNAAQSPAEARSLSREESQLVGADIIGARHDHRHGTGEGRIIACRVTDSQNRDTTTIAIDEKLTFHILVEADRAVERPSVGLQLYDRLNNLVFAAATAQLRHKLPPLSPGQRMVVSLTLSLSVKEGAYTFGLSLAEPGADCSSQPTYLDCLDLLGPLEVSTPADQKRTFFGIARLPMSAHHALIPNDQAASASP
ncbi:MAG: ABC transporter ATP-binding protein [Phycisphaeraceae bacterium]|nr:ABC transporter ATP-binding protein [Phycisphaeraceae bacterium]